MDIFKVAHIYADAGTSQLGFGKRWNHVLAVGDGKGSSALADASSEGCPRLTKAIADLEGHEIPSVDLIYANVPGAAFSIANHVKREASSDLSALAHLARLVREKARVGECPALAVAESVVGLASGQGVRELQQYAAQLVEAGYRFGGVELQALPFVPQSRSRLFLVAVRNDIDASQFCSAEPVAHVHGTTLRRAVSELPAAVAKNHLWLTLPPLPADGPDLSSIIDYDVDEFDSLELTAKYLAMMAPRNRYRLEQVFSADPVAAGAFCQRTREEPSGKVQRIEVRFDHAGCVRTAGGGSSRQKVFLKKDGQLRSRLFTRIELARLMGLPDDFLNGRTYTQACLIAGQGSVPPVLRYLGTHLLEPLLQNSRRGLSNRSNDTTRHVLENIPSLEFDGHPIEFAEERT